MAINLIDTGVVANDGTGDSIRAAFQTVNSNFDFINGGLFAGTEASIINAVSVVAEYIVSNTFVNADVIVSNTITTSGNLDVGNLIVQSSLRVVGNLIVDGTQTVTGGSQTVANPMQNLHYSAVPLTSDDNKDIGLQWQYYKGTEKRAFLGWQNTSSSLVYMDDITDTANIITAGVFGNVQFGSLLLSNATPATSNVTGALQVAGGVGIQGNLYTQSNLFVGNDASVSNLTVRGFHVGSLNFSGADTVYINGSPVQTAATSFNGGTVGLPTIFADATQATSTSTGAVRVSAGGLGVAGNIWASNIHVANAGSFRGNIIGNVLMAAQPFITSLGTLTGLNINGQLNVNDISPNGNQIYSLGTATNDRWLKIWTYDIDVSGQITGGTVNSSGGTHTGATVFEINSSSDAVRITQTGSGNALLVEDSTNPDNTPFVIDTSGNVGIGAIPATGYKLDISSFGDTTVRVKAAGQTNGLEISQLTADGGNKIFAVNNNYLILGTNNVERQRIAANGSVILSGNLFINSSGSRSITHAGDIVPTSNLTANIGSSTAWYNTFFGVSTQARYADLAEHYRADAPYEPGTVVIFGGAEEITVTQDFADHRVAGVISTNPAYLMNAAAEGLPVALRGRVPVKVIGPVAKGDLLVTATTPGYARSVGSDTGFGLKIFAKAIEANPSNKTKIIEAVIL